MQLAPLLVFGGDIGSNGCVAIVQFGALAVWYRLMNGTYPGLLEFISNRATAPRCKLYLENVHWRPGDQRKPTQIETMFRNAAKMELCFEIAKVDGEMVEPSTWQLEFALGGIDDYDDRKRAAQAVAQAMYPHHKITKDAADGILIATYGWRKEAGVLTNGRDPSKEARQGTGIQWESRQKI